MGRICAGLCISSVFGNYCSVSQQGSSLSTGPRPEDYRSAFEFLYGSMSFREGKQDCPISVCPMTFASTEGRLWSRNWEEVVMKVDAHWPVNSLIYQNSID